jgi:hypothetical protein
MKTTLRPKRLSPEKTDAIEKALTALTGRKMLFCFPCDPPDGHYVLCAMVGCYIPDAIRQMVQLAGIVRDSLPYIECEFNTRVVRARAGDDAEALSEAWRRTPNYHSEVVALAASEGAPERPKNNDGRSTCFWCGASTKRFELVTGLGNVCTECGR